MFDSQMPNSKRVYSSSNYNLIAAAIERVMGKPFAAAMDDLVFSVIGLKQTSFDDALRVTPHRVARYSFYHPWTYAPSESLHVVPRWDYSFNPGGGNLLSTGNDLAAFGNALWAPGLLSADGLALLSSDAWFGRTDERNRRLLFMTGANPGVQAGLAIYPDQHLTAAVLSNTWGVGSRSGEMVELPMKLAQACFGS